MGAGREPASPASRTLLYTSLVTATAALGGLLFGFDTGVISGALLFIAPEFHLGAGAQGFVVGVATLGALVGATYAPPGLNTIEHFVDGGLVYIGLVPGRDTDALGLFALFGHFSPDLRRSQVASGEPGMNHESILELNYQYDVTPWLYLQPDVQGVLRPNGTGRVAHAFVMALQVGITL